MATLATQTIANTFDSVLHVEDDTAGLVATSTDSRVIQDGVGANSALALATDSVRITSTNKLYFNDVGGEYISGSSTVLSIVGGTEIDLASAAIDINATGAVTIDSADDSNLTVTGSNKDLAISVVGGSTQTLTISSAGTGADAIGLSASAGGITVALGGGAGDDFIVDTTTLVVESDNNRVGIGTATPGALLNIAVNGSEFARFSSSTNSSSRDWGIFGETSAGGDLDFKVGTSEDAAPTVSVLTLAKTGDVGIGATSPDIDGSAFNAGTHFSIGNSTVGQVGTIEIFGSATADDADTAVLGFLNTDNSGAGASTRNRIAEIKTKTQTDDINDGDDSGGHLLFRTKVLAGNMAERMRITSGGNVGIGTSSPDALLELEDAAGGANIYLSRSDATIADGDTLGNIYAFGLDQAKAMGALIRFQAAGTWDTGTDIHKAPTEIQIYTQDISTSDTMSSPVMVIDSVGNVGIGDTDPSEAKLSITGVASGDYGLKVVQDQNTYAVQIDNNGTASAFNIENTGSTGRALQIYSNMNASADSPLVDIHADNALFDQAALKILQDGAGYGISVAQVGASTGLFIDQDGEGTSIQVDTEAQTSACIHLDVRNQTSGNGINIESTGSVRTTGKLLYALSSDTNTDARNLVEIVNDAAAATGTICLKIQQDSTGLALDCDGGAVFNESSADVDFRVESNGQAGKFVIDAGADAVLMGSTTAQTIQGEVLEHQISGTGSKSANLSISRHSDNNGAPALTFYKSRHPSPGSFAIVADNDVVGHVNFAIDDGTDALSLGASILARIDGTPGANDTPTELTFNTCAASANDITQRMTITPAGDIRAETGDIIIGTAGKGINFEDTGGDARVLDDYEEGTWTPDNAGYNTSTGLYTKIGRLVTLTARLDVGTINAGDNKSLTSDAPFTCTNTNGGQGAGGMMGITQHGDGGFVNINNNSTTVEVHHVEACADGEILCFTLSYMTA